MVGARRYRGDEYGMFVVAALPAWFLGALLAPGVGKGGLLVAAWAYGIPLLVLLGWLMDRGRTRIVPFVVVWVVLAAAMAVSMASDHPTLRKAVSKNGSLWAYVFAGLGFMTPAAALLALLLARMRAGWRGVLDS
jgi:hypothetical protein